MPKKREIKASQHQVRHVVPQEVTIKAPKVMQQQVAANTVFMPTIWSRKRTVAPLAGNGLVSNRTESE